MALTKKHFEQFAQVPQRLLRKADTLRSVGREVEAEAVEHDAQMVMAKLADICATENPRFDVTRFYEACGFLTNGLRKR